MNPTPNNESNLDDDEPLFEIDVDESDTEGSSGISSKESASDRDGTEGDDEFEIDLELEAKKGGELGALARQAQIAEREIFREQTSEEEGEAQEDRPKWGSRSQFYETEIMKSQVTALVMSICAFLWKTDGKEVLEESMALQKAQLEQLQEEDFDLPTMEASHPSFEKDSGSQAVEKDGEALVALHADLKKCLEEVQTKLLPLLKENGDVCTEQGMTYLETKHLLLLHYCSCIVFYLLLKLEGASVKDHPVVTRLIEIRTYLEKIKPIEARLRPQVEKLLKAVTMAETEMAEEMETLAPRPEELIPKIHETDALYRAPKLVPISMDDEQPKQKHKERNRKPPLVNPTTSEIVREITGAPDELSAGGNDPDHPLKAMDTETWPSNTQEVSYGSQMPSETAKRKMRKKSELSGGVTVEKFSRDIQNTLDAIYVPKGASEDDKASSEWMDKDSDFSIDSEEERVSKRPKKTTQNASFPPKPPKTTRGRRAISNEIQKNRGLTPYRTRERKNPRRRHRLRFESKEKRRKGSRPSQMTAPDRYGGEASGISKRVKKSVRFA